MKNGVEMIFGIFNVLSYFDRKAENWRKGGYAYKIFVLLGLILVGAITVGFVVGAVACFIRVNENALYSIVFGLFGILCAFLAIYCAFYFLVETISLIIICAILVSHQKEFLKNQATDFKAQKKAEQMNAEADSNETIQEMEFDAKDQYQKENLEELRPVKKPKRIGFKQRLQESSDMPYLKTKTGFDITIMVLTCILVVGIVAWAGLMCSAL